MTPSITVSSERPPGFQTSRLKKPWNMPFWYLPSKGDNELTTVPSLCCRVFPEIQLCAREDARHDHTFWGTETLTNKHSLCEQSTSEGDTSLLQISKTRNSPSPDSLVFISSSQIWWTSLSSEGLEYILQEVQHPCFSMSSRLLTLLRPSSPPFPKALWKTKTKQKGLSQTLPGSFQNSEESSRASSEPAAPHV